MVIDFIPSLYNPISVPSVEGRCHEASWKRGRNAVPAGLGNTHPRRSGGAGVPPGGTRTPREELADGACYLPKGRSAAESAARSPARHRHGAPRGAGFSDRKEGLAPEGCDPKRAPRGAPFPHRAMREKGRVSPAHPAPVKQYGR